MVTLVELNVLKMVSGDLVVRSAQSSNGASRSTGECMVADVLVKADDNAKDARQKWFDLLADEGYTVKRSFFRFVNSIQSSMSDNQIMRWIYEKDLKGFIEHIQHFLGEFADELPEVYVRAATNEIKRLSEPGRFGIGKDRVNFDKGNRRAARAMERSRLRLIREINTSQRESIKEAISDSIRRGVGPRAAARQFREAIGLTRNQVRAVNNYQSLLERTSGEALNRALRDARFDRTVERAIDNGDLLSGKQIEKMVQRYALNMRNHRAETIARTETMRTLNEGKQESWKQIAEQLGMNYDDVERTWVATLDDRTRDTHAEMNGQTVTGMETPFESPSGEELLYPGDPFADGAETINCRCTLVVKFPSSKMRMNK
jgi:hypothetical protein